MSAHVRALPIPGYVREVRAAAYVLPSGRPGLFWTVHRDGAYHGVELYGIGPAGTPRPFALLDSRACRELARSLELEAARLEAAARPGRQW